MHDLYFPTFGEHFQSRSISLENVRPLASVCRHLDDIDLFAGGLAERPVKGGLVGPTFACIIGQQFLNLKVRTQTNPQSQGHTSFVSQGKYAHSSTTQ